MARDFDNELTETERTNRLVIRLAELVRAGALIEEQARFRAVVVQRTKETITPNVIMILAGLALFAYTRQPLFALAALVAALGWHRKILSGETVRRLLIRVDERGRVSECEIAV
jgi:hypothetical protein